jgi:channel protein (hemolysin III family)
MNIYGSLGCMHPLSSLTHLGGAVFFAVQAYRMLRRESGLRFISFAVFAGSCVFLLVVSGIYHWLSNSGVAHMVFQRLDHAGIFLVIAGSFTPIHCNLFTGFLRWGVLVLVWGLSLVGLVLKLIFFNDIPEWLGLTYYLGLGWMGLITGFNLWRRYNFIFIRPLIIGGIFYTLGGLIEYQNKLVLIPGILGPHELLHVGVLLGIGYQWGFIVKAMDSTQNCLKRP